MFRCVLYVKNFGSPIYNIYSVSIPVITADLHRQYCQGYVILNESALVKILLQYTELFSIY